MSLGVLTTLYDSAETGPRPHIYSERFKTARGRLTSRGRRALAINLLLERLWREQLKALHLTIHNNEDHSMAIQIRCRNPEGKIEKMEIKLEQPWTANVLTGYFRDAGRPRKTFIFLVPNGSILAERKS